MFLRFVESKRFEEHPRGLKPKFFPAIYGTTEVVPCYKTKEDFFNELQTHGTVVGPGNLPEHCSTLPLLTDRITPFVITPSGDVAALALFRML